MAELQEVPIAPPPGVVKSDSLRVIEGRWSDTINMRFVQSRPQKIGGWTQLMPTPTQGTPRALHAWRDVVFNAYLAVGTYAKLYVYDQNRVQWDITPYRATGTLAANPLTTTAGSPIIRVAQSIHGLSVGDLIHISGATAVGGIVPNMAATAVSNVIDNNTYTYIFTSNATSSATGGGAAVAYKYEVPIGVELGTYGFGYGVGGYGLDAYDTPRTESTIVIEPRVWSLDHFGKLLLAAYNGGAIYQFDPTAFQPWGQATIISADPGLPSNVRAMFVTPERFIMALCENMQVAWPSQGTLDIWTPLPNNTANVRVLTEGTKLVAGRVLADFVSLIWTDAALYRFQYTGATYVYASSMVAKDCGLLSPNAVATVGGVAYWMGQDQFWTYNGSVMPMTNSTDIRKWVFDEVDINLGYQANANYSPVYNEIWFFFTDRGQTNPTRGLIYSIDEKCWAPLYWGRAGGTHYTQGETKPIFGGTDFFIYQHEDGNDDNGAVLQYSMTLAPYALTKGGANYVNVEFLVPDFFEQNGDVTVTLRTWNRLNDSSVLETEAESYPAVDGGSMDTRINGRYIGMTVSAGSLGSYVRFGLPVVFLRAAGRRSA